MNETTTDDKYINAVFNFDVDTFKTLLENEPFDVALLSDIKFAEGVPCPIYWITQCWETVFEAPEEWGECRETIAENKRKNLEIKKIFEESFGVAFKPIDFYNTDFWSYRNEREDSFEDVFWGESRDEMIARGRRAIDLDLYVAVNKFDFKETERLLKAGADPAYEIPEEECSCLDRVGTECALLEIELQGVMIDGEQRAPNVRDLVNLVGCAAHERMFSLLSSYMRSNN